MGFQKGLDHDSHEKFRLISQEFMDHQVWAYINSIHDNVISWQNNLTATFVLCMNLKSHIFVLWTSIWFSYEKTKQFYLILSQMYVLWLVILLVFTEDTRKLEPFYFYSYN